VDSSYLQALWGRVAARGDGLPPSWSVSVDHPHTWEDTDYAMTASQALGTRHTLVPADGAYRDYLLDALAATAEPPNHVQSAYFGHLARAMRGAGATAGLCGEGADSLFGLGLANQVHNARTLRRLAPVRWLRALAGGVSGALGWAGLARTCRLANGLDDFADLRHPVNLVAAFTDWEMAESCFGTDNVAAAAAERRRLLDLYCLPYEPMDRLHAAGFLGEAVDSAGLWATLFNRAGADLLCPFLDSRVVRVALNLPPEARYPHRRPKWLLKQALTRHAPAELATRRKLGFGQPIFEWLAPGGQLRAMVDDLDVADLIDADALARLRKRPTWFLYSLVVFDSWRKLFITRSLERPRAEERGPFAEPARAQG
jgi:asparagine synthase (glutamine-hydrolysing)